MNAPQNLCAPVLRWPGGKWRIAEWIVSHLPQHDVYVEPFFGSGAVFFSKSPARVEIINDLDDHVVLLMRVLREQPAELAAQLQLTPWSQREYRDCWLKLNRQRDTLSDLECARCLIVVTWQQIGRRPVDVRTNWRFRNVSSQSPVTAWHTLWERIGHATERLLRAQISSMPALKLIEQVQGQDTLLYVDPPYLNEVRSSQRMYRHEMRHREEHAELLDALRGHVGPVVLSAYANDFYHQQLPGWHALSTGARTQTNAHRAETIWLNGPAWKRVTHAHPPLFLETV